MQHNPLTPPPLALLDGHTLVMDNSTMQLMTVCPAMGAYKVLWKREGAGTAIERDAGKALHSALEHRYRTHGAAPPTEGTESEMLAILEGCYAGLDVPDNTHLTLARMKEVVLAYNRECGQEPFRVRGVEVPYAVPLGVVPTTGKKLPREVNVVWTGRSDMVTEWEQGTIYTTDHKSMGRYDGSTLAKFENDDGQKGYAWSLQEVARLHPELGLPPVVHGFCLNAIVVRPEYKRAPASGGLPRFEVHRHRFHWLPAMLEEWRTNTLAIIGTWLEHYERGYFPMHRRNCASYFGRMCPYKDVDAVVPAQRAMVLASDMFKDVTWNPLDRDGAEVPS